MAKGTSTCDVTKSIQVTQVHNALGSGGRRGVRINIDLHDVNYEWSPGHEFHTRIGTSSAVVYKIQTQKLDNLNYFLMIWFTTYQEAVSHILHLYQSQAKPSQAKVEWFFLSQRANNF